MPPAPAAGAQTTIIVAACSAAGGLIVLFLTYRLLRYLFRPRSYPLPPVQPLARERELLARSQQTAARPASVRYSVYASNSFVSLPEPVLVPPLPTHHHLTPSPSISSLGADSSENAKSASFPETPNSFSSSALSHSTFTSTQSLRPHGQRYPRSRPMSAASSSSTIKSRSNRFSSRGIPHGPHSNVQIVLPMPLAPTLLPHAASDTDVGREARRRHSVYSDQTANRLSVIDKWAPIPSAEYSNQALPRPRSNASSSKSSRRASATGPTSEPTSFPTTSPPVPPIPLKFVNIPTQPFTSPSSDEVHENKSDLSLSSTSQQPRVLRSSRRSQSRSRSRPPAGDGSATSS